MRLGKLIKKTKAKRKPQTEMQKLESKIRRLEKEGRKFCMIQHDLHKHIALLRSQLEIAYHMNCEQTQKIKYLENKIIDA